MNEVRELFDKNSKRYDQWYEENKLAYISEIQAIKKFLSLNTTSLEIGVGTGRFATALNIDFGIDPSYQMLKLAKNKRVNVAQARGEEIPCKNGEFQTVLIAITLCFLKDVSKVITEAHRVMKKNGSIVVGIIDKNSALADYYRDKKSDFYKYATFFSVKEVIKLLKEKGFTDFSYYQTLFDFPNYNKMFSPKEGYGEGAFVVIRGKK